MRKHIYIGLAIAISAFQTTFAQESEGSSASRYEGVTNLSYSMAFPVGDLYNYISTTSFRGISVGYSRFVNESLSMGITGTWNIFYQEVPNGTYTYGTATLSGKQWRYTNSIPIMFNTNYNFMPNEKFSAYAGLGIGTIYTIRNTDMSLYTNEQETWNFALQPELGINYEIQPRVAMNVALKYFHGFQSGEIKDNQTFIGLNLGFAFFHR